MFSDAGSIVNPWVWRLRVSTLSKPGSVNETEKFGKALKKTGPSLRLNSINPSKESENL